MKVIALYSSSIDGKIAKNKQDSLEWISSDAQKFFRAETTKGGIVITGRKTFMKEAKPFEHRYNVVLTKNPKKYTKYVKEDVLEFTSDKPTKLIERLTSRKPESIFITGGQSVFSEFMEKGLIDEVWTTVEPVLFGSGVEPFKLDKNFTSEMELLHLTTLSKNTVLLKYTVSK